MGLIDKVRRMTKKEKIVLASVVSFIVVAIVAVVLLLMRNNYLATTMRLLRVEGTVNIEDSNGTIKPVIDEMRFESGDALSTGSDGIASVGLDDTKIVTLENDSRVEFQKHGKQLELNLTAGGLFFEVTQKLADDEKYEIKTSNMTVGIRGTSGYVYYSKSGLQSLIITDGVVKVTGYNPKTQETKEVEVRGGEMVTAYLYDESTEDRDSIEFEIVEVPPQDVPEFALQMLVQDEALLEKVCADTGWDKDELLALVNALLDPDSPTPTPDEIIEITNTPEPTAKPTKEPVLTPTASLTPSPSASPNPTKKPTSAPTNKPTATPAPGSTSAPSAAPTQNPSSDPTSTPTATPNPTTTVKPTATPTTKPIPTTTTTPTTTPTATPKVTPTIEPTPVNTPTPEPTPAIEADFSNWDKYVWGETYSGHKVYILTENYEEFVGFYDGEWVLLDYQYNEEIEDEPEIDYWTEDGYLYYVEEIEPEIDPTALNGYVG